MDYTLAIVEENLGKRFLVPVGRLPGLFSVNAFKNSAVFITINKGEIPRKSSFFRRQQRMFQQSLF